MQQVAMTVDQQELLNLISKYSQVMFTSSRQIGRRPGRQRLIFITHVSQVGLLTAAFPKGRVLHCSAKDLTETVTFITRVMADRSTWTPDSVDVIACANRSALSAIADLNFKFKTMKDAFYETTVSHLHPVDGSKPQLSVLSSSGN